MLSRSEQAIVDSPGSDVEQNPRQFSCAHCGVLVVICRRCDGGNIYCGPECASARRIACLRRAGRMYQQGREGRKYHAKRQGRYRARQEQKRSADKLDSRRDRGENILLDETLPSKEIAKVVTHQGTYEEPRGCTVKSPSTKETLPCEKSSHQEIIGVEYRRCCGCGCRCGAFVRSDLLSLWRRRSSSKPWGST